MTTYGTDEEADIRAVNIEFDENVTEFDVVRSSKAEQDLGDTQSVYQLLHVKLRLPGIHNVRNSLAAIAGSNQAFPLIGPLLLFLLLEMIVQSRLQNA